MNETIRENPHLKQMLRHIKPLIINSIEMALYDYQRYGMPTTTLLVKGPLKILLALERHARKTDKVMALDQNLFFITYQNTSSETGKLAFEKVLRLFPEEVHKGDVAAALIGVEENISPEEMIERLVVALHNAGSDEKSVLVDASKI